MTSLQLLKIQGKLWTTSIYKVFKAQVNTIDAHGGNAGHHPIVYQLHLAALVRSKERCMMIMLPC